MNTENTNWNQSVTGVVIKDGKVLLGRHTYGGGKGMLIMPMLESSQVQGMHKVPLLGCPPLQVEIGWMTQDSRREIPKFVEIAKKIYC